MKTTMTGFGMIFFAVFVLALGFGAAASVWADEPIKSSGQTDKEVQERASEAPSGDVQERGVLRGMVGGTLMPSTKPPVLNPRPTGFYCLKSQNKCYCDRTKKGDCELMQDIACMNNTYHDTSVLDGECTAWMP